MATTSFFALLRIQFILLVLLLVIPAFGLVLYGNLEQRRIEKERVREAVTALSRLAAANQEIFIKNTRQLLATLCQFPYLVLGSNRTYCGDRFSNLQQMSPDYLNFGLIETDGTLYASGADAHGPINLADRPYFQRVLQTGQFSIGDFQVGRLTGEPSLNFGYPVVDEDGKLRRVLFASLKLSLMSRALENIRLPPGAAVTVLDRTGTVLARYPEPGKWVGKSLSGLSFVQTVLAQKQGVFETSGVDDVARLYAVTAVNDGQAPGLFVSVGIPLKVSFAHANELLVRNTVLLGLVAVLILLGARFYAQRSFLGPINALVAAANRLAEGDLSARTGGVQGAAELVQLGRAFDGMAERLEKRQAEVEQAHEQISRLNAELERRVQQRTAQLESANNELEAFSYSVSHDLRAPLRHIDGFTSMLESQAVDALDESGKRYLRTIAESARRMGMLIDDLLVFSRMGRIDMRKKTVDLEQLIQETIRSLEHDTQGRNIDWKYSKLPKVEGDPSLLRQVFANLLGNAVKYTRPRDPARIEIGCANETPDEMVVFVRDNGVGFDMQFAQKLFGVFQRLHRADEFEGTGIGLANVRRIILRHGGRTWAEGNLGEGATFYFSLPKGSV